METHTQRRNHSYTLCVYVIEWVHSVIYFLIYCEILFVFTIVEFHETSASVPFNSLLLISVAKSHRIFIPTFLSDELSHECINTHRHTHTQFWLYIVYTYIYRTTPTIERAAILCVSSVSIAMGYLSTSVSVNCRLGNILMLLNYTSTWLDLVHQHIKGLILQRHTVCHVWHYFIRKHCFLGIRNSIVVGISVSWQKTS